MKDLLVLLHLSGASDLSRLKNVAVSYAFSPPFILPTTNILGLLGHFLICSGLRYDVMAHNGLHTSTLGKKCAVILREVTW